MVSFLPFVAYADTPESIARQKMELLLNRLTFELSRLTIHEAKADVLPAPELALKDYLTKKAREHGVSLPRLFTTLQKESGFNLKARGDKGKARGLWQIHKDYHPTVTDECADNLVCSTEYAMPLFKKHPELWSAYREVYMVKL